MGLEVQDNEPETESDAEQTDGGESGGVGADRVDELEDIVAEQRKQIEELRLAVDRLTMVLDADDEPADWYHFD